LLAARKVVWDHTDEFDMKNLEMLWAYIKKQVPSGGIPGDDDRQYRDLKQYYEKKLSVYDKSDRPDEEKRQARDVVNEPLNVCNLDPEGNELYQPDTSKKLAVAAKQVPTRLRPDVYCPTDPPTKKLAVAATLLATSIVLNVDTETLQKVKQTLERRSISNLEALLKLMLTKGDLVVSERFPISLELKNFGSLPLSKGRREQYIAAAENAYGCAVDLMMTMNQKWPASSTGIPEQFKQTFRTYFGDPNAKVDAVKLGFYPCAPVRLVMNYRSLASMSNFSQPRWACVRAVLNCVWQGLQTKMVRLYFGGSAIIPDTAAYHSFPERSSHPGRINVHLAYDFFSRRSENAIKGEKSSRAGVLIHEFTHALAGTTDAELAPHALAGTVDAELAYSAAQCKRLAEKESALTNAQSYAFFVEDALG
jgi:Lysine-specific metallo-endopeptidase